MPEGPEVETIRRSLLPLLKGRVLGVARVSSKKLRIPVRASDFAAVRGARVTGLFRKGKLLLVDAGNGAGLFVRLGMTGKLLVVPAGERAPPHTHVRIALDDGREELRYVDARRFGSVVPFAGRDARDAELARLGADGLQLEPGQRAQVVERLRGTGRALKDVLLDQQVLCGVGNIYAAEALFVARLSPFSRGTELTRAQATRLVDAVGEVLAAAVGRRGTSFSDYVDGLGVPGDNLGHLHVFQREGQPCRTCGSVVERVVQGQRSTFFCPRCQRVSHLG